MKITIEVSRNSHRYITLIDLLRRDHYQFSIEAENEALQQHVVMQRSEQLFCRCETDAVIDKNGQCRVCGFDEKVTAK